MGKAKSKSEATIEARLEKAAQDQRAVRIKRAIPGADVVKGYIVAISDDWVALATPYEVGSPLESWSILRRRDIKSVRDETNADVVEKMQRARGFWPPPALDGVDLSSAQTIAVTASAKYGLIMIQRENLRPHSGRVGRVLEVSKKRIVLHEVDPRAEWYDEPTWYPVSDITRFEVADGYLIALGLVAGEPPAT